MSDFHFIRPWCFLILPLGWTIMAYTLSRQTSSNPWQNVCDAHLLRFLQPQRIAPQRLKQWGVQALCWLIATITIAGPTWQKAPTPIFHSPTHWVIVLDMSPDMLKEDIKPSRLVRAQYKITDLLNRLADSHVGLVAYADDGYVVTPLTTDKKTILHLLPPLKPSIMPGEGQAMAKGLQKAMSLVTQTGGKDNHLLLITSGAADAQSLHVAQQLKDANISLSILSLSTKASEQNGLQDIAKMTHGAMQTISLNDSDIDHILSGVQRFQLSSDKQMDAATQRADTWLDQGYWLIILLLWPVLALC